MRATYYISFNGTDYSQFYPSNEPKVKLTQEPGEIFFRDRVDSFKITKTLNSTIYTILVAWFFDPTKFSTEINYRIKENGVTTYEFLGSILKGKINTETGVYEANPEPDDAYKPIMDKYQSKYMNQGVLFPTGGVLYTPKRETQTFTNVDFSTFADAAGDVSWTNSGVGNQYARIDMTVLTPDDTMTTVLVTDFTGDDVVMQLVDESFTPISNTVTINADGKYELTQNATAGANVFLEIYGGAGDSGSFTYEAYYPTVIVSCSTMFDLVTNLLTHSNLMNLTIGTVYSTYLWNDPLDSDPPASIDTYITANPTNDYVIEGAANWNELVVTATEVWTTAQVDKVELSLKDLMDYLKIKLRAWWAIDSDGYVRIEHEKYWRSFESQKNLTTEYKSEVDAKIYTYDYSNVFHQVNYTEANQGSEDWIAAPVVYSSEITSKEIKEINIRVSSDVKYLVENADDATADGIVIVKTTKIGSNYMITFSESTKTSGAYYPNAELGWYYLMANYFKYFADAESGTVNGAAFTFDHVKEFLRQDGVSYFPSASIDWRKPFTLSNGTGWLISSEYSPETGMAVINVGFNPYE